MSQTFILVHGAYVGEWCFDPIRPLLEAQGHRAFAVSLSGHGKLSHLSSPDISLDTHIEDVVDFVEAHKLDRFVLVGHSYGGAVITGAWDRLRTRVSEVIFIDAATPEDGMSMLDGFCRYGDPEKVKAYFAKQQEIDPLFSHFPLDALKKKDPEKWAFYKERVMPQSVKTSVTPLRLQNGPLPTTTPKKFILCLQNKSYHFAQAKEIKADKSWHYFELDTHHDAMAEDPEGLVEILTKQERR